MSQIQFEGEPQSNSIRQIIQTYEPKGLRTFTPTQAVLARSAGIYHWTPEGKRLYDYSSGVLVANLGHNPRPWFNQVCDYLGWSTQLNSDGSAYFEAVPLTAYNAITEIEAEASERLANFLRARKGGGRLEQVLWAASGSEGIQKALWACLHSNTDRDMILATRDGFHGKKGLAGAVTGSELSPDRDPRVRFLSFPKEECVDVTLAHTSFDPRPYEKELTQLWNEFGSRISTLITEPYLGGGGSYHPPKEYLQLLERFCREHEVLLVLDEVQSNFGRTGEMFAFETYGIEPDIVVLGKGMGNGAAVSATVGRADLLGSLDYGEASDTYSANPFACAAVLATLDLFEANDLMAHAAGLSACIRKGLLRLKELEIVRYVRGEGTVWGVEIESARGLSADEVANLCVEACYLGEPGGDAIHLLGPLAGNVLRIGPPLVMSIADAEESLSLMYRLFEQLSNQLNQPIDAASLSSKA